MFVCSFQGLLGIHLTQLERGLSTPMAGGTALGTRAMDGRIWPYVSVLLGMHLAHFMRCTGVGSTNNARLSAAVLDRQIAVFSA